MNKYSAIGKGFGLLMSNRNEFMRNIFRVIKDLWSKSEVVKKYNFPVCFDFPAGHIPDNHSLILGKTLNLSVNGEQVTAGYV